MPLPSASCIESNNHYPLELSQETLKLLWQQIESELFQSEAYCRSLAGLEKKLGESTEGVQLVKAVAQTAIYQALRQVMRLYMLPPQHPPHQPNATSSLKMQQLVAHTLRQQAKQEQGSEPPVGSLGQTVESPRHPSGTPGSAAIAPSPNTTSTKGTTKGTLSRGSGPVSKHLVKRRDRTAYLRQVGQLLQTARQSQSLSLDQLHSLTRVAIHHLQALESGNPDRLTEADLHRAIRQVSAPLGLTDHPLLLSPASLKSAAPSAFVAPQTQTLNVSTSRLATQPAAPQKPGQSPAQHRRQLDDLDEMGWDIPTNDFWGLSAALPASMPLMIGAASGLVILAQQSPLEDGSLQTATHPEGPVTQLTPGQVQQRHRAGAQRSRQIAPPELWPVHD